jgi:hypothetical protein
LAFLSCFVGATCRPAFLAFFFAARFRLVFGARFFLTARFMAMASS